MADYIPIKKVIRNRRVLSILRNSMSSGEDSLLVEMVEDDRPGYESFFVYAFSKDYDPEIQRPDIVARVVRRKVKDKIREYKVKMERPFYIDQ